MKCVVQSLKDDSGLALSGRGCYIHHPPHTIRPKIPVAVSSTRDRDSLLYAAGWSID